MFGTYFPAQDEFGKSGCKAPAALIPLLRGFWGGGTPLPPCPSSGFSLPDSTWLFFFETFRGFSLLRRPLSTLRTG